MWLGECAGAGASHCGRPPAFLSRIHVALPSCLASRPTRSADSLLYVWAGVPSGKPAFVVRVRAASGKCLVGARWLRSQLGGAVRFHLRFCAPMRLSALCSGITRARNLRASAPPLFCTKLIQPEPIARNVRGVCCLATLRHSAHEALAGVELCALCEKRKNCDSVSFRGSAYGVGGSVVVEPVFLRACIVVSSSFGPSSQHRRTHFSPHSAAHPPLPEQL